MCKCAVLLKFVSEVDNDSMEKLVEIGRNLGLEGAELRGFVVEQQEIARAERAAERAAEREAAERAATIEREAAERAAEREAAERAATIEREAAAERAVEREAAERAAVREFELERLRLAAASGVTLGNSNNSTGQSMGSGGEIRGPKIPCFVDGKDQLDCYLMRFERYVQDCGRTKETWASTLSVLLTGRALEVYSRLSDEDAKSYDVLKEALLRRYDLTEGGYRRKFRNARPGWDENPGQFLTRLSGYLAKWVELSGIEYTITGVLELLVKEQFMNVCSGDLTVHLNMNPTTDLQKFATLANNFVEAHGRKSFVGGAGKARIDRSDDNGRPKAAPVSKNPIEQAPTRCYKCGKNGHKSVDCWGNRSQSNFRERKCFICQQVGHLANACNRRNGGKPEWRSQSRGNKSPRKPLLPVPYQKPVLPKQCKVEKHH